MFQLVIAGAAWQFRPCVIARSVATWQSHLYSVIASAAWQSPREKMHLFL